MGLFDSIGDMASGFGGGLGNIFGGNGVNTFMGGQGSTPAEAQQDALVQSTLNGANSTIDNAQNVQNGMVNNAQAYRKNMQGTQDQGAGLLAENSRQDFANKLRGNNSTAQSRGLLYSGIKQAGDQQAANDYATSLAQGRNQVNNAVNQQANQLDQNAMSNGLQLYNQRQGLSDTQYQNTLNRRNLEGQQTKNLTSGVGSIVGGLL